MQDFLTPVLNAECPPSINHYASGGKIKRSTVKQCKTGLLVGSHRQTVSNNDVSTSEQPIDSFNPMSKVGGKGKDANMKKDAKETKADEYLHSMQSIFLGSDRRYNRYWIFLGPCDEFDPGHKRIYFESSEDGHWEVIDTQEVNFVWFCVHNIHKENSTCMLGFYFELCLCLINLVSGFVHFVIDPGPSGCSGGFPFCILGETKSISLPSNVRYAK